MQNDLLTFTEAARIAHVSPETIRYWLKVGRVPKSYARIAARSGKPYGPRVRRADLEACLTSTKLERISSEIEGKLVSTRQLAGLLQVNHELARAIERKLKPKRYYLQPKSREFFIDLYETLNLIENDDWYRHLAILYRYNCSKPENHSCIYCA